MLDWAHKMRDDMLRRKREDEEALQKNKSKFTVATPGVRQPRMATPAPVPVEVRETKHDSGSDSDGAAARRRREKRPPKQYDVEQ